jgi:hypothetical protein
MGGNMIAIKGILLNSFFIKPVYSQTIKWANELSLAQWTHHMT